MKRDLNKLMLEYSKCIDDPIYSIENYLQVTTLEGIVPFKLFEQQKRALKLFNEHDRIVGYKSRQVGFTTLFAAFTSWYLITAPSNKPKNVVIIANLLDNAKKILRTIRDFVEMFPPEFIEGYDKVKTDKIDPKKPPQFRTLSTLSFELCNGSKIKISAASSSTRGLSASLVVVDEASYLSLNDSETKEFIKGVNMTMSSGSGKCIISSTPNGLDPLYYPIYKGAREGTNNYKIATLRWENDLRYNKDLRFRKFDDEGEIIEDIECEDVTDIDSINKYLDDGYDGWSSWFQRQCTELNNDQKAINSELLLKFIGSAGNVVSTKILEKHQNQFQETPVSKEDYKESVWIFEKPIEGNKYLLASDVGKGDGGDYSTFYILNAETCEIAVEFKEIVTEPVLAQIINKYGLMYNALVVIDVSGGYGGTTINNLEEMQYPHLYYEKSVSDPLKNNIIQLVTKNDGGRAGFIITEKNRHVITTKVQSMIEKFLIKVKSIRLHNELITWVWKRKGNKVRADHQRSAHDDLIMCLGIGLYVIEYVLKHIEAAKALDEAALDNLGQFNPEPNRQQLQNNYQYQVSNPLHFDIGSSYMSSKIHNPQQHYQYLTDGNIYIEKIKQYLQKMEEAKKPKIKKTNLSPERIKLLKRLAR